MTANERLEATTHAGDPVLLLDGWIVAEMTPERLSKGQAKALAAEIARRYNAAPDLLQAAKCALAAIQGMYERGEPINAGLGRQLLAELRAAITLAEEGTR